MADPVDTSEAVSRQGVGGVLLAAGRSSRVGTMKPLLDWRGRTMLRHITRVLLDAYLDPLVIVLGHEAERLRSEVDDLPVQVAVNDDYDRGMFSSVRCGLRGLTDRVDACVLALVDQPRIDAELVRRLIREHTQSEAAVTLPAYAGQTGHPIVLSRTVIDAALRADANATLRDVLAAFADRTRRVEVASDSVLKDIDTMDDYRRQRDLLPSESPVDTPEEPTP